VVDDQVGHQVAALGQRAHTVPGSKAGIRLRVINGIETRIGAVNRVVKRQEMRTAE